MKEAQLLLQRALEREAEAQLLLLAGEGDAAAIAYGEVAELYRRSWERAHEGAYGRLAGMLKAAILAGGGDEEAAYAREQLPGADSAAAAWALALAALILGEDREARAAARAMGEGDEAFRRAGEAADALAAGEASRYERALEAIVRDFERREGHLTGVAIADTALVLERLAEARDLAARPSSALVPNP